MIVVIGKHGRNIQKNPAPILLLTSFGLLLGASIWYFFQGDWFGPGMLALAGALDAITALVLWLRWRGRKSYPQQF